MSVSLDVNIGEHKYQIGRLSVFDQMNVASEYRDVLTALAMLKKERPKEMDDDAYLKTVQFLMASRGGVTPATRTWVANMCLGKVMRHSGGVGWTQILAGDGVLQYDIELPELFQLLYLSFEHNRLLDFFSVSPSISDGQMTERNGQPSQMDRTGS